MLRTPIDGDEPFYLLVTESIAHDADLDLANQYRTLDRSATGRADLVPQLGDPTGKHGQQYSRHEPLLPLLMVPGYAIARLPGAVAIIALFGVLLVRSTVRWMEDEGISERAIRGVFPFFAFGPPVIFYAARIWTEVPAAFCYVETLRGMRNQRVQRWLPALIGLVLLKLRFGLLAVGCLVVWFTAQPRNRATKLAIALGVLAIPLIIAFLATGNPILAHSWRELIPGGNYARGLAGLLADGMSGIAFRGPFYLLGLFAITRWRSMPRGFRDGILASLLYLLYLAPRPEWFGGWAPPLRYIVFLAPVLALGAAAVWDRISPGVIAIIGAWTVGLAIHGLARPFALFHIANGENTIGEWFSAKYHTDFSRLFPSFIRMNEAAWIGVLADPRLRPVRHPTPQARSRDPTLRARPRSRLPHRPAARQSRRVRGHAHRARRRRALSAVLHDHARHVPRRLRARDERLAVVPRLRRPVASRLHQRPRRDDRARGARVHRSGDRSLREHSRGGTASRTGA